jgi:prepilin-type N-terminal cleavage/methylation domain-containing protein
MRLRGNPAAGFTLIELVVAVSIMALLMMLAIPTMDGVLADRRLRRSLDGFNALVREAQERSIAERRAYLIVWHDSTIGLRPEGLRREESAESISKMKLGRNESLKISFPAALAGEPPAEWIFWPSGNCEPAVVSYKGESGNWKANYSALTARGDIVAYVAK